MFKKQLNKIQSLAEKFVGQEKGVIKMAKAKSKSKAKKKKR